MRESSSSPSGLNLQTPPRLESPVLMKWTGFFTRSALRPPAPSVLKTLGHFRNIIQIVHHSQIQLKWSGFCYTEGILQKSGSHLFPLPLNLSVISSCFSKIHLCVLETESVIIYFTELFFLLPLPQLRFQKESTPSGCAGALRWFRTWEMIFFDRTWILNVCTNALLKQHLATGSFDQMMKLKLNVLKHSRHKFDGTKLSQWSMIRQKQPSDNV